MRRTPWYPQYAADTLEEFDNEDRLVELAVRRLRDKAWNRPECTLPEDESVLRRWARLTPKEWSYHRFAISQFFEKVEVGFRWSEGLAEKSRREKRTQPVARQQNLDLRAPAPQHNTTQHSTDSSSAIAEGIESVNAPRRGEPESQIPVARDRRSKARAAEEQARELWNTFGESAAPDARGASRDSEHPWHTRYMARRFREDRALRERYIAEIGRNPEDPSPGWVNRTGKWQFIGRPGDGR